MEDRDKPGHGPRGRTRVVDDWRDRSAAGYGGGYGDFDEEIAYGPGPDRKLRSEGGGYTDDPAVRAHYARAPRTDEGARQWQAEHPDPPSPGFGVQARNYGPHDYRPSGYGPDEDERGQRGYFEGSAERGPGDDRPAAHATGFAAAGSFRGRGPQGYSRSDDRIREDVCEALTVDHEVDATNIDVVVAGGEVTLTGVVPERRMKRLATSIADRCRGVSDVHNQLRVAGERSA